MKKNYLYNLFLSVVNILFPILSFPYASRILGPVGIGKVQFVSSFAQYFALIAALGIPIYGIQEIAKCRLDKKKLSKVFSELTVLYCISSLLLSVVYLIIIHTVSFFKADSNLYYYASLYVILGFSCIDWFYSGLEEFRIIALRSVFIKIVGLFFLYFFVRNSFDYKVYLLILLFSTLGNNMISMVMLGDRVSFNLRSLNLRKHLKPLFFIFGTTLAASMYTILDVVLLGFLANETAVGFYTAAAKLTRITIPFVTSICIVLMPKLAQNMEDKNQELVQLLLDKSFHFISFLSIPVAAGLMILAPEFIYIFSGPQFKDGIVSMQILSILPILVGFGYFFAFQILVPVGKNREMFLSVLVGMIIGFLLNFILVPRYKEAGASIASISSELLVTSLYFYFIRRHFTFTYQWSLILKSITCSLTFIPLVLIVRYFGISPLYSLLISVFLCTVVYIGAQYFLFKDSFIFELRDVLIQKLNLKGQNKNNENSA